MVLIPGDLAKKLWKDDEKMLDTIEGWESVRCSAEVDDEGAMELTPNGLYSDDGTGIHEMHKEDGDPIGAPVTVQLKEGEADAGEERETPLSERTWTWERYGDTNHRFRLFDGNGEIAVVFNEATKDTMTAVPRLVKVAKAIDAESFTALAPVGTYFISGKWLVDLRNALKEMGELE